MKVLVTAASRHAGTWGIAEAVREALADAALDATLARPQDVEDLEGYLAVVLGSGVYAGHWLEPAKEFAVRFGPQLRERRVWLFSSGPLGDPLQPDGDPADAAEIIAATDPEEHRVFAGRLARSRLGFAERAIVTALRAPEGDFRDWGLIRAWATGIARSLGEPVGAYR